jgi:hypothetical protein
MILHVQYQDLNFDYVAPHILDDLITGKNLQRFYRPSEERWVNVFSDPIHGVGGDYSGPDRRQRQEAG